MIDPSLMKHLPPQQAEQMRAFEQMFSSDGWRLMKEILGEQHQAAQSRFMNATTWADNRVQYGILDVLTQLLAFEQRCEHDFTQVAEAMKAEAEQKAVDEELEYE